MIKKVIIITGPTAIGKSSLAMRLAKKINGSIINADSMQVYSELNILTAKPTNLDTKLIPHYLYGYVNGKSRYNVFKWCNDIMPIIETNYKKNVASIIVGGTGMYIEKLLNGLADIPEVPETIKKKSQVKLNQLGLDKFCSVIKEIDLESLSKINKNDLSRLRRIWEVFEFTNKPLSEWIKNNNKIFLNNSDCKLILFKPNREKIYDQINKRFISMIENGAIDEVENLIRAKYDKSLPIMRAHGVPEITDYILKNTNIEQCISKGQQVTRNYAKRQLTWWRSSRMPIHQAFDEFPDDINLNLLKI